MIKLGNMNVKGIFLGGQKIIKGYAGDQIIFDDGGVPPKPDTTNYLTFTAQEPGATIALNKIGGVPIRDLEYDLGDGVWKQYEWAENAGHIITLANVGDKIRFRGDNVKFCGDFNNCYNFVMTKKIAGSGSIMTLIDKKDELRDLTGKDGCFIRLFEKCVSLTKAPELPATTLAKGCYNYLFGQCTNLSYVKVGFAKWGNNNNEYTLNWLYGVASKGRFVAPPELDTNIKGPSNVPNGWIIGEDTTNYLTFTAEEPNSDITLEKIGAPAEVKLEYDLGDDNWTAYNINTVIPLNNAGDKVRMRAESENKKFSYNYDNRYRFKMNGKIAGSGSIMTLCNRNDSFEIPSGANGYFLSMFQGCTSLTKAPELPATTLTTACYGEMFYECTSLTKAPELPATTLAQYCYNTMFCGCSSLSEIKAAFTSWGQNNNYATRYWVGGVAHTGKFICPQALDASIVGPNNVPSGWTVERIVDKTDYLTFTAVDAGAKVWISRFQNSPAIKLEYDLGDGLWKDYTFTNFDGENITLTNIGDKVRFRAKGKNENLSKKVGDGQYNGHQIRMTGKVAASGSIMTLLDPKDERRSAPEACFWYLFGNAKITTAPILPATELGESCYGWMFSNCKDLTKGPDLMVKKPGRFSYANMFRGCTALANLKVGFEKWQTDAGVYITGYWVEGASENVTFECPAGLDTSIKDTTHVLSGWTIVHPA